MTKISISEFIDELKFCISGKDMVKARALLQFLPRIEAKSQIRTLYEISKAEDRVVHPVLCYMLELPINDASVKNRLYDLLLDKSCACQDLLVQELRAESLDRRLPLIRIAGELQVKESIPLLSGFLSQKSNPDFLRETIKALSLMASQTCIRAIADFIFYGDEELKQEAIFALAQIGGPTAIHLLSEAIRGNNRTDQLIIEALGEIQDQTALERLTALLNSHYVDVRNWTIDKLVAIGPKAVPVVVENLKETDDDALVHTLNVLGNIGDKSAIPAIQKILYRKPDNANVRFAAYEAMERLPAAKAAISLATGLEDPEEQVRLAAARAVDKNLSPILTAGLKNMIAAKDESARQVVATLIDAGADKAFENLIREETFSSMAVMHLASTAHPDTRTHYLTLIQGQGLDDLAQKIMAAVPPEKEARGLRIFVVDDSKMMLRIYKSKLHAMGHTPLLFDFPSRAIEAALQEKPDLLITDLNMPDINGIQLTKELRRRYPETELPIIMITTQSDFVGQHSGQPNARIDTESMKGIGISMVMHKPFDDADLAASIQKLT
ncbi:HEAT repeat domain-containing protein [Desulfobotulus sp. H1]|uniref:HEAT repeat domain-containing protein n=1 Tax=Desulfobotulus pelophilus TaxID=2823377 RepID=A0ABT3N4N8_9BACT|nr:HEAT repeat domain-containing protein [Desulfobotulus pelophilus]MCW7752415.1 HEAT repeat domain-containing protein [Desulfobotulus pelophilus]